MDAVRVSLQCAGERCWIRLPAAAAGPKPGEEVTILIDEGTQWFDLRAIRIHGRVREAEPSTQPAPQGEWLEVERSKMVAWHYGSMREVKSDGCA